MKKKKEKISNLVKLNLYMKIKVWKLKKITKIKMKQMKRKLKINNNFQVKEKFRRINKVLHSYKSRNDKKK